MSNKLFDYKCIPDSGSKIDLSISNPWVSDEARAQRAFRFFLTKKNDKDAVQIIIPEKFIDQLPTSCDEVHVYCRSGIYDTSSFNRADAGAPKREKLERVRETGCIYLTPDDINCIGEIRFAEGGCDIESYSYVFAIAYIEKELITYTLKQKGASLEYRIEYPMIRREIEISLIEKLGSKPVLKKDLDVKPKAGARIVLKPAMEKINVISGKIPVTSNASQDTFYALVFSNKKLNDSYMLRDDTVYDMVTLDNPFTPSLRCPFCNRKMHLEGKKLEKGHVYACTGDEWDRKSLNILLGRENKINIVCSQNFIFRSSSKTTRLYDSFDEYKIKNPLLPDGYLSRPSLKIAVAGMPDSGKTVYLASLFGMGLDEPAQAFKRIARSFKTKLDGELLLSYENINDITDNSSQSTNQLDILRRGGELGNRKIEGHYDRYRMGKAFEARTQSTDADVLAENPVGFDLGKLGLMYFYDVPGEVIEKGQYGKTKAFTNSDCIIAIVDGYPSANNTSLSVNDRNRDAIEGLSKTISFLKEFYQGENSETNKNNTQTTTLIRDVRDVPIAIVFTKYDMRLPSTSNNPDECFGENTHVTLSDLEFAPTRKYKGSEFQRHIDASSDEVRSFLCSLRGDGKSGKEIIDKIESVSSNVKYFALSALGSNECMENGDNDRKKFISERRMMRVEYPVMWLMHKRGII